MNIDVDLLKQAESHLGINTPYQKGINISVENCWHFSTDGNFIDRIFDDDQDFKDGMNRIFIVSKGHKIIVLAFCLMDTHIHFILYGKFDECNGFVHKYVSHTSRNINIRHGIVQKLLHLPIHYQKIDNDFYLKVAICYVLKNPPVAGLSFHSYDYPWSSSALYFRGKNNWTSPIWTEESYQKTLGKLWFIREMHSFR